MMQYQLPIFEKLCPSWEKVLHLGLRTTFKKGMRIFDLTTQVNGIYLVKEGSVEILLDTSNGPEKVLFYIGSGGIFGEVSCFVSGGNDEASATARTDCVLYFFRKEVIEGVITEQHPRLLLELIGATAYKLRMFGVLFQDTMDNDMFVRVCKMLVYLVRYKVGEIPAGQKQVSFCPEITQTDLAKLMGIHRVTVTKALSRLRGMGVVKCFSKRLVVIEDYAGLIRMTEEGCIRELR